MLTLTRECGEGITIQLPDGRTIEIVVARCSRGQVRLGFTADRDILIFRTELLKRERREDKS